MLTRLRIQNFKAWKDTGEIRLAPITVVFGANSSGKTSIHQLLLMLKQTAQSPDRQRLLHPGDDSTIVDLGTIQDLVFGHQDSASIAFEIEWVPPDPLQAVDPITQQKYSGDKIRFRAKIRQQNGKAPNLVVDDMRYDLGDPSAGGLSVWMAPDPGKPGKYELGSERYHFVRQQGRPWPLAHPVRFYGFPDEAKAYYQNADFLADLALAVERMLGALYYVGPLRDYPERSYVWSGERPDHVGKWGERVVEAILAARERKLSRALRAPGQPFEKVVARWLKEMGLIEDFQAKPLAPNRKQYEVLVQTAGSKHTVNLTDVGFGVSQVLPVVVECFYVPADSTIVFEQPEIHLHPRVQAALADLFVEATHMREDGRNRSIQLLVESHSEHFLRRLQRRIAEQRIKPEEIAMYFCEPGPDGSTIRELQVDDAGNITNWPDNFFGDEMGDLAAMAEAAMQREATNGP